MQSKIDVICQQNINFGFGRLSAYRVAPAFRIVILLLTTCCSGVGTVHAGDTLTIELAKGSDSEEAARVQLVRLVNQFDIEQWLYTEKVLIDDSQWIPHSHPVLTLNSRYLDDDLSQLATFLHEQFHWYAGTRQQRIDAAISDLKEMFPEVPSGRVAARDKYSTYLHLIICDLELAAMQKLVGDAEARRVLGQWQHYTWIYNEVLNNSAVRAINEKHGLPPP
jgi:hypothetical protein